MSNATPPSPDQGRDIFDRNRRSLRRARGLPAGGDYIGNQIADMLIERLDDVARRFEQAAIIGARNRRLSDALIARGLTVAHYEQSAIVAAATGAVHGEEDQLPWEPGSQSLILWPGGLESVNDVPGALLRCRLSLRPDGLLLGCFAGDGSFPMLRQALTRAQRPDRPAVARMHPQIDARGVGDILQRCGFALPVVDIERITLGYSSAAALVRDLRAAAMTNMLAGAVYPLMREEWQAAAAAFAALAPDDSNRTAETLRLVHFTGWAPDDSQPRPARRGSATASLAAALNARG